jgi:molybdenum cofactor biosynthesis enzyme
MWRGRLPPSFNRSHRCQAVDVARKTTTVWRTVATGEGGYGRRWRLRGRLPPSFNRSHPLPSGGCGEEDYHRHSIVATRCQAVDVARKTTTVWRTVATGGGGCGEEDYHRHSIVATRCQAVEVARKTTTVWRAVATGGGGCYEEDFHRLASGGYGRRWLRVKVATGGGGGCEEDFHRLASGGYGRRWRLRGRLPPSGERWLRVEVATGGR